MKMKKTHRYVLFALLQIGIVLSLAGKYFFDRLFCPRVWVKTAPVDPNLPIRGRYVRLRPVLPVRGMSPFSDSSDGTKRRSGTWTGRVKLQLEDGQLVAVIDSDTQPHTGGNGRRSATLPTNAWFDISETEKSEKEHTVTIAETVPFFIPEHILDPSIRSSGEELWVEVTIPKRGPLRPIRLAVKKGEMFSVLK